VGGTHQVVIGNMEKREKFTARTTTVGIESQLKEFRGRTRQWLCGGGSKGKVALFGKKR